MNPYLQMCVDAYACALLIAYLYAIGLYAESFTMLGYYLTTE